MWSVAKVAGPVIASVVALAISLLNYHDQHSTDEAATLSARQQYARQVSAWLTGPAKDGSARLMVQNLGNAPITGVAVDLQPLPMGKLTDRKNRYFTVLGAVPPCSTATLRLAPFTVKTLGGPLGLLYFNFVQIRYLEFVDANGISWVRQPNGSLRGYKEISVANDAREVIWSQLRVASASGCA
jgi:hypothetical protein